MQQRYVLHLLGVLLSIARSNRTTWAKEKKSTYLRAYNKETQRQWRSQNLVSLTTSPPNATLPFDRMDCPRDLVLHDRQRDVENPGLPSREAQESSSFFQKWLRSKGEFQAKFEYGTLDRLIGGDPRSLLRTVEDRGKFVYWRHIPYHRPIMEMSLFNNTLNEDGTLKDDGCVHEDSVKQGNYKWDLVVPESKELQKILQKGRFMLPQGPKEYIVFVSAWHIAYQHYLIDQIGYWAYLRDAFPEAHFILLENLVSPSMLSSIDPQFLKERVSHYPLLELQYIDKRIAAQGILEAPYGTKLSVVMPIVPPRHVELLERARRWIWQSPKLPLPVGMVTHPQVEHGNSMVSASNQLFEMSPQQKKIIYCMRVHESAGKGRIMDETQEEMIVGMIRHAMMRYKRPEELVVFKGKPATFVEQVELFRSASIVIGPHGGALANLVLSPQVANSCQDRTKVIEFVTTSATPFVQNFGGCSLTYYYLFSTMPWIEMHHVFYVPPSNQTTTYIDLNAFHDALSSVMSRSPSPSSLENVWSLTS